MEYLKSLLPVYAMRSVSLLNTFIAQKILPRPKPRDFRICTHNRCLRRGVVATSLEDLVKKIVSAFLLTCQAMTLVLEEDGTVVDTDAFFQALPAKSKLMVLENGQIWTQSKGLPSFRQPKKKGIANLSLDLYKLNPRDFIGCLTIKATLYEIYALSCDIKCTRAKQFLLSFLRCLAYVTRIAGHVLLCGSSYLLELIGEDE